LRSWRVIIAACGGPVKIQCACFSTRSNPYSLCDGLRKRENTAKHSIPAIEATMHNATAGVESESRFDLWPGTVIAQEVARVTAPAM
jgi:hypothetical protein